MDRHSSFISIWLQLELCAMAVLLTKGEIRCYCDAPHCVATGYMCKSELNHCFTKVLDPHNANSPLTHGCLDPVANAADVCGGSSSNKATTDFLVAGVSTLECCHDDMCNYRGLHDLAHTRDSTDHSRYQPGEPGNSNRNLVTRVHTELASAKEVWFRAAVIAVPIAGGLILVLLIMLALRMLRSENKRLQDQRQQMLSRLHYSFHGSSHHHHSGGAGGGGHTFKGKGGHGGGVSAKLDLECMVPVTGHENCCLTCDKMRQADGGHLGLGLTGLGLGGGNDSKIMSLVHWGMYSGHGKLEFV